MRIGLTKGARVVGRQVEESVGKTGQGKPLPEPYILLRRDENKDIGEKNAMKCMKLLKLFGLEDL